MQRPPEQSGATRTCSPERSNHMTRTEARRGRRVRTLDLTRLPPHTGPDSSHVRLRRKHTTLHGPFWGSVQGHVSSWVREVSPSPRACHGCSPFSSLWSHASPLSDGSPRLPPTITPCRRPTLICHNLALRLPPIRIRASTKCTSDGTAGTNPIRTAWCALTQLIGQSRNQTTSGETIWLS